MYRTSAVLILFVQIAHSFGPYNQVFSDGYNYPCECFPLDNFGFDGPWPGFAPGYNLLPLAPTPIPQASISVLSENVIEGVVKVIGQLPFVSSIAMSGEFPTSGAGSVAYGCGDEVVIVNDVPRIGLAEYPYAFDDGYRGPCCYGPFY